MINANLKLNPKHFTGKKLLEGVLGIILGLFSALFFMHVFSLLFSIITKAQPALGFIALLLSLLSLVAVSHLFQKQYNLFSRSFLTGGLIFFAIALYVFFAYRDEGFDPDKPISIPIVNNGTISVIRV